MASQNLTVNYCVRSYNNNFTYLTIIVPIRTITSPIVFFAALQMPINMTM